MEVESKMIVEEREELMVSSSGGNPIKRKSHFLNPCSDSTKPFSKLHSLSASAFPADFDSKICSSVVNFAGWEFPLEDWTIWVKKMAPLHETTWRKAGIFEAIQNSTIKISRNNDLFFGIAEKWYGETKSFIFPWGEATITLEDVMILGSYSVLGSPVVPPIETEEMKKIKEKLENFKKEEESGGDSVEKARSWIEKFKDGPDAGSEIEHYAFLAFWLSRFVFPCPNKTLDSRVFPLAIRLGKGIKIALAPAILASIYRDLSRLRNVIAATRYIQEEKRDDRLATTVLCAPLYLVQVWAWERFVLLRPMPRSLNNGESRLSRWRELNREVKDVRLLLDSAKESFDWLPYARSLWNWKSPKFPRERETLVFIESDAGVDDELLSFARFLRVSELVGIDSVEQYLPHRVARQFGLDQDLPGYVSRSSLGSGGDWDGRLYVPSRFCQGEVTMRYSEWWKESELSLQEQNASGKFDALPAKVIETKEGFVFTTFLMVRKEIEGRRKSFTKKSKEVSLSKILKSLDVRSTRKDDEAAAASVPVCVDPADSVMEVENEGNSASAAVSPPKTPRQQLDFEAHKEIEDSPLPPSFPPFPPGFPPKKKLVEGKRIVDAALQSSAPISVEKQNGDSILTSSAPTSLEKQNGDSALPSPAPTSLEKQNGDSALPSSAPTSLEERNGDSILPSALEKNLENSNGDSELERKQMDSSSPVRAMEEAVQKEQDNPLVSNCEMVAKGCAFEEDNMTIEELFSSMAKLGDAKNLDQDPKNKAVKAEVRNVSSAIDREKLMPKEDDKRSNRKRKLVVLVKEKRKHRNIQ